MEVLEVSTVLSCFKKFLKIRFIVTGKSAITLHNSFGQNADVLC